MTTNLFGRESNREKEEREKDREREKEKERAGKDEIETKKQNAKGCRARNRYSALPDFIPRSCSILPRVLFHSRRPVSSFLFFSSRSASIGVEKSFRADA